MNLFDWIFAHIWIGIIGLGWLIWTIFSVRDAIRYYKHRHCNENPYGACAFAWIIVNGFLLFVSSAARFCTLYGGI